MIVELFGAPGVGKTSFARALVNKLQEQNQSAEIFQSYRPAELRPGSHFARNPATAALRRLARPMLELLVMARNPSDLRTNLGMAMKLLEIHGQKEPTFGAMRMAQYIVRLNHGWSSARGRARVVVFDQAFAQTISSLVLRRRGEDDAVIDDSLDQIPMADLFVRLVAPRGTLEARLRERERLQSKAERRMELDLQSNLEAEGAVAKVEERLRQRGQWVERIDSQDWHALEAGVAAIAQKVTKVTGAKEMCAQD